MLANLDDSVGSVLAKLREENLEEDTLIFFISDIERIVHRSCWVIFWDIKRSKIVEVSFDLGA